MLLLLLLLSHFSCRVGSEEKGEGGDRGDLVEKKESQKGERAIRPVISFPSKNRY